MILRILVTASLLTSLAVQAHAQQPLSVGTATALSEAAVTEARRTDAALWNPALVAVYDGPISSYSVLAIDVPVVPGRGWSTPAHALGLDGGRPSLAWARPLAPSGGSALGVAGVQWFASQHRGFSLGLSSHYTAGGGIPAAVAGPLGARRTAAGPTPQDSTMRAVSSVLSAAAGTHVGRLPLAGSVWIGATAKAWWLHSYARGAFDASAPEQGYREVILRNVPGYGVDLGLLTQPMERLRVGVSVANVVAGALRPKQGPRVRTLALTPEPDGRLGVDESYGPYVGTDDGDTEDGRLAGALWSGVAYPTVLRAGATIETDHGSFSGAVRSTLKAGGLDPEWIAAPYTLAYSGAVSFPLRGSYAFGGGERAVSLGLRTGSCERRWGFALVRRSAPWGTSYGLSGSATVGSAAGCDVFRT